MCPLILAAFRSSQVQTLEIREHELVHFVSALEQLMILGKWEARAGILPDLGPILRPVAAGVCHGMGGKNRLVERTAPTATLLHTLIVLGLRVAATVITGVRTARGTVRSVTHRLQTCSRRFDARACKSSSCQLRNRGEETEKPCGPNGTPFSPRHRCETRTQGFSAERVLWSVETRLKLGNI